MSIKSNLLASLFAICIILQIHANDALKTINIDSMVSPAQIAALQSMLETQGNRIALLESTLAKKQSGTPNLFRIKSLGDMKDWAWENKGKIAIGIAGVVTFCTIKTLFDNSNERLDRLQNTVDDYQEEIRSQFARADAQHAQTIDNQTTLLTGLNDLRNHHGLTNPLAFNQHNIPDARLAQGSESSNFSPGNILNTIVHTIGNTAISLTSRVFRNTASMTMRAAGRVLSL